jgi:predicted nucleotide-binding protein
LEVLFELALRITMLNLKRILLLTNDESKPGRGSDLKGLRRIPELFLYKTITPEAKCITSLTIPFANYNENIERSVFVG